MEEETMEESISSPESPSPICEEEDRFSLLPNGLIHHILSLLGDMKITVQMSILSKRWRHVWRSLKVLVFEYEPGKSNSLEFKNFVTRALFLRDNTDLDSLTVLWIDYFELDFNVADTIKTWTLYACKRNVKELVYCVGVNHRQVFEFPECIFNCESLVELCLFNGSRRRSALFLPESTFLPRLEVVKFENLILNEVSMNEFFKSFPTIESVTMINCLMGKLRIVSVRLKHFELAYSYFDATVSELASSVLICAPNLETIDIKCYPSQIYSVSADSLVRANVEIIVQEKRNNQYTYSEIPGLLKDGYAKIMMLMLENIHSSKDLTLSPRFIQIISRSPDLLKIESPQLANLRRMKLHTFLSKGCAQAILCLLRISPNIEYLYVHIDKDCFAEQPAELYCHEINYASESVEDYWKQELGMLSHLKSVKLLDIDGSITELRFIEVLLKYAAKLEKVFLYWNWDGPGNNMERVMKFNEKLHSLPRASPRVSTLFY